MKRLILVMLLTVACITCSASHITAEVPHLISYQGRLTDATGIPIEGSRSVTFRIYDSEVAGNLLWNETHSNVTATEGIFEVLLGSVTSLNLPFDKQYYLAIKVGSDPEMSPRKRGRVTKGHVTLE